MMWKKICKALLFPHIAVLILLLPVSIVALIESMTHPDGNVIFNYATYALSAYTLTVWCVRIPDVIKYAKKFRAENRFAKVWFGDTRLRVNASLIFSTVWNSGYGIFQLALGIYHRSAWFYSLAGYYICLALMRLFLARHSVKNQSGEKMYAELRRYRACGWIFFIVNLILSAMMFYMLAENRAKSHNIVTTIALATYTFFSFTMAIINVVRFRKYESPVFSAAKAISLAYASVSMLTLESTMLATFGGGELSDRSRLLFMGGTGTAIFLFITAMAIYMIVQSTKKLKVFKTEVQNEQR